MEITEFFGFIVTILIFLWFVGRNLWALMMGEKKTSAINENGLFDLNFDDDEEVLLTPKPIEKKKEHHKSKNEKKKQHHYGEKNLQHKHDHFVPKNHLEGQLETENQKMPIFTHSTAGIGLSQPVRGAELIKRLESPKEMIILAEIIGLPRSLDEF